MSIQFLNIQLNIKDSIKGSFLVLCFVYILNKISDMTKKRQDILNTAGELFNEFGFINIGIDRIIEDSNVAKMTFYKYFPSKNNLIKEVLKARDMMIRESILEKLQSAPAGRLGKLSALFDWYSEWFSSPDFFGCLFVKANDELIVDELIKDIIYKHKEWMVNQILDILVDINESDPKNKAFQIMIILDGSIINESIIKGNSTIKRSWEVALKLLD